MQKRSFFIETVDDKGKIVKKKKVVEIKDTETKKYKLLGEASGNDFFHGLYLAVKYCKNFRERVVAYCVNLKEKKHPLSLEFYEKK